MGSGLSTELGAGLARIGPVARVVHSYIGGATIALAYGRGLTDASESCGVEGDVYAIRTFNLYCYRVLLSAIRHGKNQFALDLIAGGFPIPIVDSQIWRISNVIIQYKNIEFLREAICRYDTRHADIQIACHDMVRNIVLSERQDSNEWMDDHVFIARCITMPLPRQHLGHDVINYFVTAPFARRSIPFIHKALPDSADAARFEREVRAIQN